MIISVILIIASFAILYFGAELALAGSEKIGKALGLSPLAIGMLLVGMGTSLPELFVSHLACIDGEPSIAIGNIIGSNLANMFLVLGLAGLLMPITLNSDNTPFQLASHLVLGFITWGVFYPAKINYYSSLVLIGFFVFFLYSIYSYKKKSISQEREDRETLPKSQIVTALLKIILGFVSLYYGGEVLVKAGTEICQLLKVPTYVLSVILVAFGTSFPELATSIVAALKKKDSDLIIGNIIGSNIFNVTFILGSLGVYDIKVEQNLDVELSVIILGSVLLLLLQRMNKRFFRVPSAFFIATYVALVVFWVKQV